MSKIVISKMVTTQPNLAVVYPLDAAEDLVNLIPQVDLSLALRLSPSTVETISWGEDEIIVQIGKKNYIPTHLGYEIYPLYGGVVATNTVVCLQDARKIRNPAALRALIGPMVQLAIKAKVQVVCGEGVQTVNLVHVSSFFCE